MPNDSAHLAQKNRQLAEHNQALAAALRDARRALEGGQRPAPTPSLPPPTELEREIARALKRIVLNRAEESLEIFADLGGHSPAMESFYQKLFHSWVMLGARLDGSQFARRLVFGVRGKLHARFLRAYCLALEELSRKASLPARRRRQWLLELAELNLEHPERAMDYLMRARRAA